MVMVVGGGGGEWWPWAWGPGARWYSKGRVV